MLSRFLLLCLFSTLTLGLLLGCEREESAEAIMEEVVAEEEILDPVGGDSGERVETVAMTDPTLSGSYLAMRIAMKARDDENVKTFVKRGLAVNAEETIFQQAAFPAALVNGDYEAALAAARQIRASDELSSILADTILVAEAVQNNDAAALRELIKTIPSRGTARALRPFLEAWASVVIDERPTAEITRVLTQQAGRLGAGNLAATQAALIHTLSSEPAIGAERYLSRVTQAQTLHNAAILATILHRAEQPERAVKIISVLQGFLPNDDAAETLRRAIEAEDKTVFRFPQTPATGLAATLIDIAMLVRSERAEGLAQSLARISLFLDPGNPYARHLIADIALSLGDPETALTLYQDLRQDPIIGKGAAFEVIALLVEQDRDDEARVLIDEIAQKPDLSPALHYRLSNSYRAVEAHREALAQLAFYTDFLETQGQEPTWDVFYARAISHDALGDWPSAEADLERSLEKDPNQPYVLNYLGYSWADKGINIDKALEYIRSAVQQRPQDGYIIDSLGWVYFKLGRYHEAAAELEKAVQLLPTDPVLNDHLGDVYWRLERRDEARTAWRIALENATGSDKEHERVRTEAPIKLEQGL